MNSIPISNVDSSPTFHEFPRSNFLSMFDCNGGVSTHKAEDIFKGNAGFFELMCGAQTPANPRTLPRY